MGSRKLKITAVSVGTRGDVEPLIELGTEMIRRGHEFRVAALEKFRPLAEQRQVPFIHLDGDADYFMKLMVTDYRKSTDFVNGYRAFYESVPGIFDQIADAVKGQDAAFYGTCSFFVRSACDYHHVTCIRYFFSPFDRTNQYSLYTDKHNSPMVGLTYLSAEPGMNMITMQLMNRWRTEHGLKKWTMFDDYRKQDGKPVLTFYPVSPVLMPPDPKWGEHIHVTGYWYHPEERMGDDRVPDIREEEKPVFVAFGKASSPELSLLQERMIQVLTKTGIPTIVQADQLTEETRKQAGKNITFIGTVSYAAVFQKVRAVVHHGGNSTNGLGLRAGLPTLVIPLALDQYYYGRTVHELQAGPAPLYIRKRICSEEELEAALKDLVSGKYDAGAKRVSEKLLLEDGCREAADILEKHFNIL